MAVSDEIREVLIQYADMKEEIKDLRRRIDQTEQQIRKLTTVQDSVKGTRRDGTIGSIKIEGYPFPEDAAKRELLRRRKRRLEIKEEELLELTNQAYECLEKIEKSELRIMFRLYYIDDLTWTQVAFKMNKIFPHREEAYTDENCRQKHCRYFKKV